MNKPLWPKIRSKLKELGWQSNFYKNNDFAAFRELPENDVSPGYRFWSLGEQWEFNYKQRNIYICFKTGKTSGGNDEFSRN